VHFTGTSRIGRIDVPLTCAVTAMMLLARDALESAPATQPLDWSRLRPFVLVGALGGVALLLKGPIGLMLPAAALAPLAVAERIPVRRLLVLNVTGGLVALAIAAPWFVWADAKTGGKFVRVFFLYHHFNRAFGGAESLAGHPWWFYLPRFAADFLPWTPLLITALIGRHWRGAADAPFGPFLVGGPISVLSCSPVPPARHLFP